TTLGENRKLGIKGFYRSGDNLSDKMRVSSLWNPRASQLRVHTIGDNECSNQKVIGKQFYLLFFSVGPIPVLQHLRCKPTSFIGRAVESPKKLLWRS
ncbi:MAG: hypothetical protein PVF82_13590, partial [Gammaproteobacteria bacterium]